MRGVVTYGVKNVFAVQQLTNDALSPLPAMDAPRWNCRIKGKVLRLDETFYNPLAPGDIIEFDATGPGEGLARAVRPRGIVFQRYNIKGRAPQLLACNITRVVCVASASSPPFRPRFIDRVLAQSEAAGAEALIALNKVDIPTPTAVNERLSDYERIGYRILRVSAVTGAGLTELRETLEGGLSVFIGQSGVGKSSLLNTLFPNALRATGHINHKYDRGTHTTTLAEMLIAPTFAVVDTPGIRQLIPTIAKDEITFAMREFAPLAVRCSYGLSCTHTNEPGCKVLEALAAGAIHPARYESYLRMRAGDWR
jgi:ribosome biogenesis GTPase